MDKDKKKELRSQYEARRPDMGIVCWQSGSRRWIATSKDARADHNSSLFQLKLGSWPNREMQKAFDEDPDSFHWSILKELDYEERDEDHSEELELLYMICLEEDPDAEQMRPGKR